MYIIGKQIEDLYGKKAYIIIYSLSGLGGSILSYYLAPTSLSVGASGAIFGLLSALLVYAYKERGRIQKGAISNLLFVIGINLLFGLSMPNIDNYGHIRWDSCRSNIIVLDLYHIKETRESCLNWFYTLLYKCNRDIGD